MDVMVEDSVLEQLEEIAQRNHLEKWNGFHKTNKQVLDGNSFSLMLRMTDGTQISAYGNNSYPKGYGEAEKEILALFQDLIEKYSDQFVDTLDMTEEMAAEGEEQPEP